MTLTLLLVAVMALTRAADAAKQTEAEEVNVVEKRGWLCSSGWTWYDWRCFRFVPRPLTWSDAEENCRSMKAHLASVNSAEEYHHIQKMIADQTHNYPKTWLGGTDSKQERRWLWADGSRFLFKYWCHRQPNNLGNQDCLVMNFSGKKCWDDQKCDNKNPSVCVKSWSLFD
ncbi:type-2 ice-structuring protein-like [Melanotaenia boesemani]|uniref:type-2 ice-structuring protein-like n=1 Tax=Melanotaenia boesemani TaxID=1250792 RepID=UPI001C04E371|nr:type-2 ice-structuring protein-like [Melanotaenia boesemani]